MSAVIFVSCYSDLICKERKERVKDSAISSSKVSTSTGGFLVWHSSTGHNPSEVPTIVVIKLGASKERQLIAEVKLVFVCALSFRNEHTPRDR